MYFHIQKKKPRKENLSNTYGRQFNTKARNILLSIYEVLELIRKFNRVAGLSQYIRINYIFISHHESV